MLDEGAVDRRLLLEDVQRRAGYLARFEGLQQGPLFYLATPGAVD